MCPSSTSSSSARVEAGAGLIPVSRDVLGGGLRAVCAWLSLALFALVLVGTGLTDLWFPATAPTLTGLEAEQDVERREKARFLDGSLASLIEYDRRVTSSVRRAVLPRYSAALYRWFDFADSEVIVGREGWLFLRSRVEPLTLDTDLAIERGATRLLALERALAMRGTQLVVAPVPRKSALYRDRLPLGVAPRPELEGRFEAALRARGIPHAELDRAFSEYLATADPAAADPLYFKAGTHWASRAELIAAEQVALAVGLRKPDGELVTEVFEWRMKPQETDLFAFAGIDLEGQAALALARAENVVERLLIDPGPKPRPTNLNPERVGRVALAGTSFSAKRQLQQFLSHFLQEPVFNAAKPGTNPIRSVIDILEQTEPGTPELLVLELPGHSAFLNNSLELVEDTFLGVEASAVYEAGTAEHWRLAPDIALDRAVPISDKALVASLGAGHVAHSGGGVLAVRIRGKRKGGAARLTIEHGTESHSARWLPIHASVIVPLILADRASEDVRIYAESNFPTATMTLQADSFEIVGTFDERAAWRGVREVGVDSQNRFAFSIEEPLPAHAVLALRVETSPADGELVLSAELNGEWHELDSFRGLAQGALIATSLAPYRGQALTRVRLAGAATVRVSEAFVAPLLLTPVD